MALSQLRMPACSLKSLGWRLETPVDIATLKQPSPMDATYSVGTRLFCVEWETGNISSSHRAINKMALGILKRVLLVGSSFCRLGPCISILLTESATFLNLNHTSRSGGP